MNAMNYILRKCSAKNGFENKHLHTNKINYAGFQIITITKLLQTHQPKGKKSFSKCRP